MQYSIPTVRSIDSCGELIGIQQSCSIALLEGQGLANANFGSVFACGGATDNNEAQFCLDGPALPLSNFQGLILRGITGQQITIAFCDYGADAITGCPGTEYTCTGVADGFDTEQCIDIRCADGTILSQCPTPNECLFPS